MSSMVTAFHGRKQVASGERIEVTRRLVEHFSCDLDSVLVFDDASGQVTDLDFRGVMPAASPRPVGRPRLGVQSREVTLLPRHWDWLSAQPGGASVTLRKLVDHARGEGRGDRERKDAAYRFMQAACGDMPGYEEALRALYRSNVSDFAAAIADWPRDFRRYIGFLLGDSASSVGDRACV